MSTETRVMLSGQLESTQDSLSELWEAIDSYDESTGTVEDPWIDEYGEESDPYDTLLARPLEIVWEKGEPFAVVLSTGGPHIEIRGGTRHDGSSYALHGYWSGEHVIIHGESITRTGEHFRTYVNESE